MAEPFAAWWRGLWEDGRLIGSSDLCGLESAMMIWRATKGAFLGACFAGAIGAVIALLFGLLSFVATDLEPIDRARLVEPLLRFLLLTAILSVFVGAMAGFAARLTQKGMSLISSISVVACCVAIAILVFVPVDELLKADPSYIPRTPIPPILAACIATAVAAFVGGAIVVVRGLDMGPNTEPDSRKADAESPEPPPLGSESCGPAKNRS
jgi:hypothetical protein